MTTNDQTNALRASLLARMKADAGLTALVPAARIYPSRTPATLTWPFIKLGVINDLPKQMSGANGSQTAFGTVHVFTKGIDAENQCMIIKRELARVLDSQSEIDDFLNILYDGGNVMQDGSDADAYHGVVNWAGWLLSE